jgi:hypothetical protein
LVTVPLGIGSYVRNRADEAPWQLKNLYFEQNPSNQKEVVALIERPALLSFLEAGDGPGRRLYRQPGFSNGDLFHVSGPELFKHHMETNRTVTTTQITGLIDGTGRPDIAATYDYLWITDGIDLQYTNGSAALTAIVVPDDIPMISLDVFNGYVMCVQNNSDRFYWIEPGEITIDPLNFATAERLPDAVNQIRAIGDEFWLFGDKSIEPWRATGDGDAPFQRIEGRRFDFGVFAGTAVQMKGTGVICISDEGMAKQISGTEMTISDPSVAERTRNAIFAALEAG